MKVVDRNASRLLQHNKAQREKLAILRREIEIGVEAAAAGRFSKMSVSDIVDEVMRESTRG